MPATRIIRHIGQLVTPVGSDSVTGPRAGRLSVVENVSLVLEGTRIKAIIPGDAGGDADVVLDAKGGTAVPGLIDASLVAGDAEAHAGEAQPEARRRRRVAGMNVLASQGVTSADLRVVHEEGRPGLEESLAMAQEIGRIAPLGTTITYFASSSAASGAVEFGDRVTSLVGRTIPVIQQRPSVSTFAVACGSAAYTRKEALAVLRAARGAGLELRVETCGSVADAVAVASELDITAVDRVRHVTPMEARALQATGAVAVLEPGRPLVLDEAWPSARPLLDAGVPVALASYADPATGGVLSLWTAVAVAVHRMSMTLSEALCAVTLNAAAVTHNALRAGSLEVGKTADLVILDLEDYREIPRFVVGMPVMAVVKEGRVTYEQ